jgi:hypothetical protein
MGNIMAGFFGLRVNRGFPGEARLDDGIQVAVKRRSWPALGDYCVAAASARP